jgi:3',5'-cyclic AMP phosphodiesterase CpdA
MINKSRRILFITLLSVFLLTMSTSDTWASNLKVGIIGDQTGSNDLKKSYGILQKGVDVLKKHNPDVVIHIGDLVESSESNEQIQKDYLQSTAIIKQLGIPWYLTPGDHDVNPLSWDVNSPDRSKEKYFQSLYVKDNPLVKEKLYYSFDKNGIHFISLYSLERLRTDPRWGNVFFSGIGDSQYKWLKTDLEKNADKTAIVVFLHHPMWYNWSSWVRVHQLLKKYPVIAVIAGHFHYNQDEGELDGIKYLVVGATGGNIKNASPNAGGIHHVTLMTIEGKNAEFLPVGVEPPVQMSFSSRYDMDRIQALNIILGNLYDFGKINTVFLRDNVLVGDCGNKSTPAQLKLMSLGNAAEFPVDIAISFKPGSSAIVLTDARFADDVCLSGSENNLQCTMTPSCRIAMANTSSVSVDQIKSKIPFWTGKLGLQGSPPPEGTDICLTVSFSFIGSDGKRFRISTKNPVCTQLRICR